MVENNNKRVIFSFVLFFTTAINLWLHLTVQNVLAKDFCMHNQCDVPNYNFSYLVQRSG